MTPKGVQFPPAMNGLTARKGAVICRVPYGTVGRRLKLIVVTSSAVYLVEVFRIPWFAYIPEFVAETIVHGLKKIPLGIGMVAGFLAKKVLKDPVHELFRISVMRPALKASRAPLSVLLSRHRRVTTLPMASIFGVLVIEHQIVFETETADIKLKYHDSLRAGGFRLMRVLETLGVDVNGRQKTLLARQIAGVPNRI